MLENFNISISTQFVFGENALDQIGRELKNRGVKKVLIHHDSGKFLYASGLLEKIKAKISDEDIEMVELGGVLPNPRLSLVHKGIELARKQEVDFILAIGGGSAIDSAKSIGLGATYDGDVWDFFIGKAEPKTTLPVGVVLTCPGTGSESSAVTVVNNTDEGKKLLVSNLLIRPSIAFMNPTLTYSLPNFLTACGIVDMFSHVCERYFCPDDEIGVIDRMSEGILKTLIDIGPKLLNEPQNYTYRAEVMWIGTIAHNNTVGVGRVQDWATHEIGNELSAIYDTPHAATLSIIMGSWMRYVYKKKPLRFARYAHKVFDVDWDEENIASVAYQGILETEKFFRKMGMPISFSEFDLQTDEIEKMLDQIDFRGEDNSIGGIVRLNRDDCREIYKMSF